ncbi:hypothetical protein BDZ89DRAFT_123256 [Hymenopellis radicata]|nr:hypothetical protein BDZ89DRAFT_123256 [Hymenopellis radicata]
MVQNIRYLAYIVHHHTATAGSTSAVPLSAPSSGFFDNPPTSRLYYYPAIWPLPPAPSDIIHPFNMAWLDTPVTRHATYSPPLRATRDFCHYDCTQRMRVRWLHASHLVQLRLTRIVDAAYTVEANLSCRCSSHYYIYMPHIFHPTSVAHRVQYLSFLGWSDYPEGASNLQDTQQRCPTYVPNNAVRRERPPALRKTFSSIIGDVLVITTSTTATPGICPAQGYLVHRCHRHLHHHRPLPFALFASIFYLILYVTRHVESRVSHYNPASCCSPHC